MSTTETCGGRLDLLSFFLLTVCKTTYVYILSCFCKTYVQNPSNHLVFESRLTIALLVYTP